jgi:hypothetical protein
MPVNTPHPQYEHRQPEWRQVEDCVEGARAVKDAGHIYLPPIGNQKPEDYRAYKTRALFFQATGRTADAWLGMLSRRPPKVNAPSLDAVLADIDLMGNPLGNYSETVLWHLITTARAGTLIDWSTANNRPYVAHYAAEDIVNWNTERIGGQPTLTMLMLHETSDEWNSLTGDEMPDPYETATYHQWREFNLIQAPDGEDGTPGQRFVEWKLWRQKHEDKDKLTRSATASRKTPPTTSKQREQSWVEIDGGILTRRNIPLPSIPFVFHGLGDDRTTPTKPPLLDLSEINLAHYRLSADYQHGLHIAGLPTPWAAGFTSEGDTKLSLGMTTAWVSDDTQARCGFLEFTGSGLNAIKDALEGMQSQMASLGAKAIQGPGEGNNGEAFETVRLRASSESAALTSIAEAASRGLGEVVRWLAWWQGTAESIKALEQSHTVSISKDLISHKITPQMLTALTQALQAGALSYESYFYQLVEGEVIPEARTLEEEKEGLETPPMPAPAKNDDDKE